MPIEPENIANELEGATMLEEFSNEIIELHSSVTILLLQE